MELSLEFWLPEGEVGVKKKGATLDSEGHIRQSERLVEAKRSFLKHE